MKFSDGYRNNYMRPESAFDAPLFPIQSSHLCCHERAGWGCPNWLCPRARETLHTPLHVCKVCNLTNHKKSEKHHEWFQYKAKQVLISISKIFSVIFL